MTNLPMGVMHCLQADCIDMRSNPDGVHNWILQCKDHVSKFIWLFAMPNKDGYQVTHHLRSLFFRFGPPRVLKTDNGEEFGGHPMKALMEQFRCTKHVTSHSPNLQSHGLIARANLTLDRRLGAWIEENDGLGWADGLAHLEHEINCSWTRTIKSTPFQMMFSREPRDFKSTSIESEGDIYENETTRTLDTGARRSSTEVPTSAVGSKVCGGPRNKATREVFRQLRGRCGDDKAYDDLATPGYRHFMSCVKRPQKVQCLCMGECSNGRCACYKSGAKCTARCHRDHSHVCRNFDGQM